MAVQRVILMCPSGPAAKVAPPGHSRNLQRSCSIAVGGPPARKHFGELSFHSCQPGGHLPLHPVAHARYLHGHRQKPRAAASFMSELASRPPFMQGFQKLGAWFRSRYNEECNILGSTLRPLIFGNSHKEAFLVHV